MISLQFIALQKGVKIERFAKRMLSSSSLLCSGYPRSLEVLRRSFTNMFAWQPLVQEHVLSKARVSALLCRLSELVSRFARQEKAVIANSEFETAFEYILSPIPLDPAEDTPLRMLIEHGALYIVRKYPYPEKTIEVALQLGA